MSLTNCRFYEEKYPDIDSFVMVNVSAFRVRSAFAWADIQNRLNRYATLVSSLHRDKLDSWKEDLDRRDGRICKAARI